MLLWEALFYRAARDTFLPGPDQVVGAAFFLGLQVFSSSAGDAARLPACEDPAHVFQGVGLRGGLVGAQADDPGEAEGVAGLVAVADLDGVEGDLDDDFGRDGPDGPVAA